MELSLVINLLGFDADDGEVDEL